MSDQKSTFYEVDQELINDFYQEFQESYDTAENLLIVLENNPDDPEAINDLFRCVHSIKSNLKMVGFGEIADFIHNVEHILDAIRHHQLSYNAALSDVVLLSMDFVKNESNKLFNAGVISGNIQELSSYLEKICHSDSQEYLNNIQLLIQQLNSDDEVVITESKNEVCSLRSASDQKDIEYFKQLIEQLESYMPYWQGRSQRVLDLVSALNEKSDCIVNAQQLEAAVYLHDIGMAFLPDSLMAKDSRLDDEEFKLLKTHPVLGHDYIKRIPGWDDAATMILQHHERFDGNGYPNKIKNTELSDGACMIAIADTFEAMTHVRSQRTHKRPMLRAVIEINSQSEKQFSPWWVGIFNEVIRSRTKK